MSLTLGPTASSRYRAPMSVFAGSAHPELSRDIAHHLGIELGDLKITRFADSEIYVKFEESVRGTEAFIIQPTCQPIDSNLLELLILLDALKRASAEMITVVLPYYGYARQEKKDAPREPITAKLIANLLTTAGSAAYRRDGPPCRCHSGLLRHSRRSSDRGFR